MARTRKRLLKAFDVGRLELEGDAHGARSLRARAAAVKIGALNAFACFQRSK